MNQAVEIPARVELFRNHLRTVTHAFNAASRSLRLGILLTSDAAEKALATTGFDAVLQYSGDDSGEGELHTEQIRTAVAASERILRDDRSAGLIQGAMQSGKTTTSLALQFAAPMHYMVTGQPLYPVHLLTVHSSQAEQTRQEFERFLLFYKHLQFIPDEEVPEPAVLASFPKLNSEFQFTPSLHIYRDRVLRSAFADLFSASASPEEFVARRTRGKAIGKIADRMQAIVREHFKPLLIIDEPQFGVMDRLVADSKTGELVAKPTVFKQIFQEIEDRLKIAPNAHNLVALSATPYEMYDVDQIWKIHQELGENYRGYNFIAGAAIDPTKKIDPPKVLSLSEFADVIEVSGLKRVNISALDKAHRFDRLKKKLSIPDDVDYHRYRMESIEALRSALVNLKTREGNPDFGVCIRAKNQNEFAHALATDLALDGVFEVLQYNGVAASGRSVKRIVAERRRHDMPYLLLVTNRARMGDAFPRSARYFIELAEQFTDMNAMFQGFLGRACGYGKNTTVVVSETNAAMIRNIAFVNGRYIYKPSHASIIIGNVRRGRPSTLLTVYRQDDPILKQFFERVDAFVRARLVNTRSAKLSSHRSTSKDDSTQYSPLLNDAAELGLFEYLESPEHRSLVGKGLPEFHILRPGEVVESSGAVNDDLTYKLDKNGGCRVTLRENAGSVATGGMRARGTKGGGESRSDQQMHLEPQILMRKHNVVTGGIITDRDESEREIGDWRAFAIVLPLKTPIQQLIAGDGTLPLEATVFDPWVLDEQRKVRDRAVAEKALRSSRSRPQT